MDAHENARTTPYGRKLIFERLASGWKLSAVAAAFGIDGKTVRKWRDRWCLEGEAGLQDRSSRPHGSPSRLDGAAEAEIEALRRASPFESFDQRTAAMPAWLCDYSSKRPHSALGGKPPIIRLPKDNLLGNDS